MSFLGRADGALLLAGLCALMLAAIPASGADTSSRNHSSATALHAAKGTRVGFAAYYGKGFQGKKTAAGEAFDKNEMVAAHPTYPLGTRVRVTNLKNGRSLDVRITDRGPTKRQQARGVIIDVSEKAAAELGFRHEGRTRVKTEVLEWGGTQHK